MKTYINLAYLLIYLTIAIYPQSPPPLKIICAQKIAALVKPQYEEIKKEYQKVWHLLASLPNELQELVLSRLIMTTPFTRRLWVCQHYLESAPTQKQKEICVSLFINNLNWLPSISDQAALLIHMTHQYESESHPITFKNIDPLLINKTFRILIHIQSKEGAQLLKKFVAWGADVNSSSYPYGVDHLPVHYAARKENISALALLVPLTNSPQFILSHLHAKPYTESVMKFLATLYHKNIDTYYRRAHGTTLYQWPRDHKKNWHKVSVMHACNSNPVIKPKNYTDASEQCTFVIHESAYDMFMQNKEIE